MGARNTSPLAGGDSAGTRALLFINIITDGTLICVSNGAIICAGRPHATTPKLKLGVCCKNFYITSAF